MSTVAVLGPGSVGGMLAVRLAHAGHRVICVAREETSDAIARDGLVLECDGDRLPARPEAVDRLDEPVDLLLVTVKAFALDDALVRIDPSAVARGVTVPLLNGLEHMSPVRATFGTRVAAGSIGRLEAYRRDSVTLVQTTPGPPLVRLGADGMPAAMLGAVVRLLTDAGIEACTGVSEQAVLWEKAVRLAPLAAATAATGWTLGDLRGDPVWRERLRDAVDESCAVAFADGVAVSSEAQWEKIEAMPATLTTSAARDVAAGRPSELDAIAGSVCRAGRRLAVATPTLDALLLEAESP